MYVEENVEPVEWLVYCHPGQENQTIMSTPLELVGELSKVETKKEYIYKLNKKRSFKRKGLII